jgi:phosphohistidine phosphatase
VLYLIRHGIAAERGTYADDAERPLTRDGIEKTRRAANGLARLLDGDAAPTLLLTSPLVRAVQTTELFAEPFDPPPDVAHCEPLGGGCRHKQVTSAVNDALAGGAEAIGLVGHEPDMSDLAGWLLAGGRGFELEFKKAAVCRIDFDGRVSAGRGRLKWFLPPRALRRLAE